MNVTAYTTLSGPAEAEVEAKRSRFLAHLAPAADEEAARAVIDAARRAHHDARHHCSAFVLGPDARVERSNDDGEPAGTAGAPMLEALRAAGLSDVVAVVTRWFGGTLLGTGGLIRAYSDAVTAALAEADARGLRVRRELRRLAYVDVGVADAGRIEHELRAAGVNVGDTGYGLEGLPANLARLHLALPPDDVGPVAAHVAAATSGAADLVVTDALDWVSTPH